jgi:peptidoglycan-associated lipoprotein
LKDRGVEMRDRKSWHFAWVSGFVGILSLVFVGVLPVQAWQILYGENVFLYPKIDGVGYLTPKEPPSIGRVVAPRAEKAYLIGEQEIVYCDVGTEQGVYVGDELIAFNLHRYRGLKGYWAVEIEGRLRVTEVIEGECATVIEEAYRALSIGSRVDFYKPLDPRISLKQAPEGMEGRVIWSYEGVISLGQGTVVFLDRGSNDGVEAGQCYEIYRVPAAGTEPSGRPHKEHLSTVIGELLILRTEEQSSSALITQSELPMEVGELLRAGCAWEQRVAEAPPPVAPEEPAPPEDTARRDFENVDVHFAFDSYALDELARDVLLEKARFLEDRPEVKILIEGHCDERGTEQYNLALGDRRAYAAKQYLMGLGIADERMNTVSYGEERPLDPGHNEEAWARNRRAHFVILNP